MARASKRAGTRVRNDSFNTKWLKNAAKSVGLGYKEALRTVTPNLYETAAIGAEATSKVVSTLRTNRSGQDRVVNNLKSNKYVRAMQSAYKNAISDIKTGNLAGTDHAGSYSTSDDSSDSGFSFGEEASSSKEKSSPIGSAVLSINSQLQNAAVANLKVQKANMDATIALTSASMQQTASIGTEVINQLTNINSSLQALVQFNNDNMNRLVEASVAFYEKTGEAITKDKDEDSKIHVEDVLSNKGGINMGQYKKYVKQQFKGMVKDSHLGAVASMVTSDAFIEMLASNPLGAATQVMSSYMIPKMIQTSLKGMEEAYNNFLPTLLTEIADASDSEAPGFANKLRSMIGQTFGLKVNKGKGFSDTKVNRGATPFDGETKHAITEIITKELRDQTGYLRVLAEKFVGSDYQKKADAGKEYWNYNTNSYLKGTNAITQNIAQTISDAITYSINTTSFGAEFSRASEAAGEDTKKAAAIDKAISEVYFKMARGNGNITEEALMSIIKNCNSDETVKKILTDHLQKMKKNSENAFNNMRTAQMKGSNAGNDIYKEIDEDQTGYDVMHSSYNERYKKNEYNKRGDLIHKKGDRIDHDKVTYDALFKGKGAKVSNVSKIEYYDNGAIDDAKGLIATITKSMNDFVSGVLSGKSATQIIGDTGAIIAKQAEGIGNKLKESLFGEKDETGNKKGGILSSFSNYLKDTASSFKHFMVGGAYTDRNGQTHEDDGNSVLDNMKNVGNIVKEGVMEKLFGKTKDENGKFVKSKEGLFGSITDTFKQGFHGWMDAFFGTEDDEDPEKKRGEILDGMKTYMAENLPKGVAGGILGAIGGGMMGSSILGILLGGPMFGAAAGAAAGFLAKSKTMQNVLFGKEDENGERMGGVISKKAQDFMKKNKNMLIGSAATGAVSGAITGGGVLGMVVGGPIAGSLMGMATGIILKSEKFQNALFGEMGEDGKRHGGAFKNIAQAFNKHFQGSKEEGDRKKTGMAALGAGAGALSAALIGKMGLLGAMLTPAGPIGGALVGLGLGIKAAGGNFKEWLFGKKDGLENLNGRKSDKQGVIGQIGNTINANFIKPIKTQSVIFIKQLGFTMEHDIVRPLSIAGEAIADKAGELLSGVKESVGGAVKSMTEGVKDALLGKEDKQGNRSGGLLSPAITAVSNAMNVAATAIRKTAIGLISIPGRILRTGMALISNKVVQGFEIVTRPVRRIIKDAGSMIFSGIKGVFKLAFKGVAGIFKVASAPFRWTFGLAKAAGRSIGRGVKKVGRKVLGKRADHIRNVWAKTGKNKGSIITRMRQNRIVAKADRKEDLDRLNKEIANMKMHDKNAQFINKYTKGQFSEDTDEARSYLMKVNPKKYLDLIKGKPLGRGWKGENLSVDQEKEKARVAKEGRSIDGMNEHQIDNADPYKLDWKGKVIYFLKGIFGDTKNIAKDTVSGHTMMGAEKRKERKVERQQKMIDTLKSEGFDPGIKKGDSPEDRDKKIRDAIKRRKEDKKKKHDTSYVNEDEVDSELGNRSEGGPGVTQYLKDSMSSLKRFFLGSKDIEGNHGNDIASQDLITRTAAPVKEFGRDILGGVKKTWIGEKVTNIKNGVNNFVNQEIEHGMNGGNGTRIIYHKPMGGRGILSTLGGLASKAASGLASSATSSLFGNDNSNESTDSNDGNDDNKKSSLFSKMADKIGDSLSSIKDKFGKKSNDTDGDNISDEEEADEKRDDENRRTRSRRRRSSGSRVKGRNATADATFATGEDVNEEHADKASDMATIASANAKNAKQLQDQRKQEKLEEEQVKYSKLAAIASSAGAKSSKGINSMLSKVFSKDGIKIAGLAAGLVALNKFFPQILEKLGGIISGIGDVATKNVEEVKWTEDHHARTNGGSAADETKRIVDHVVKDKNVLQFQDDGKASSLTTPTAKYLARLGYDLFSPNARQKTGKFAFKTTKRRAKFNKNFQKVRKNAGTLIKNFKLGRKTQKDFNNIYKTLIEQGNSPEEALKQATVGMKPEEAAKMEKGLTKHLKANKVTETAKSLVKSGKTKLANTKAGKVASGAKQLGSKMKGEVESLVKKGGSKFAETKGGKAVSAIAKKVKSMVERFFNTVISKFGKKAGKEAAKNAAELGPIKKLIIKGIDKTIGKIFPGAAKILTDHVTAASLSLGLSETTFAIAGAIDGATGAAKLFHINKSDVDYKMVVISTIFGAFNGTGVGSIVDLVFSAIDSVAGTELYNSIATVLYNAWSGGKDSKKAKKLQKAQAKFKEDYTKYQTKELKKQYETQKKAGIIDGGVTLDQFIAGVEDGTYNAEYKSEEDYNTDKNASIGDKAMTVVGKAGKGIKSLWRKTFGKEKSYEKDGVTYSKSKDGKWHAFKDGEDLGVIAEKSIPKDAKEVTKKGIVRRGAGAVVNGVKSAGKGIAKGAKFVGKGIAKGAKAAWGGIKTAGSFAVKGVKAVGNGISDAASFIADGAKSIGEGISKTFTNIVKGVKNVFKNVGKPILNYVIGSDKEIKFNIPEDNPGAPLVNGIGKIMEFILFSPHITTTAGRTIVKTLGKFIKTAYKVNKAIGKGNIDYITGKTDNIEYDLGDDNPLSPVLGGVAKIYEVVDWPIRAVVSVAKKIPGAVSSLIKKGKKKISKIGKSIGNFVSGKAEAIVDKVEEADPIGHIVAGVGKVAEFAMIPIKFVGSAFKKAGSTIKGFIGDVGDMGAEIKSQAGDFLSGKTDEISIKLEKDNPLHHVANAVSNVTQFVLTMIKPFITLFNFIGDKVGDLKDKATDFADKAGDKVKDIAGKAGDKVKGVGNAIKGAWSWATGGNGEGGRGENNEYFSQNDPRWKDKKYGNDGAKMGDSGCGPAAMAMAVNTAVNRGGRGVNPMQMAGLAQATGNRDETGTNWNFMSEAPAMMGLGSKQAISPSADYINSEIDSGRPVILSGKKGGFGKSAYTNAGHYVVATGRDNDGNLIIKDPRGASYSGKYNANQVASETGSAWTIGGFGKKKKGKDNNTKKSGSSNGKDWLSIVAACKKSIGKQKKGYSQSGYIDVTVDGKTINTRRDCSGFVSVCLSFYTGKKLLTSSSGFESDGNVANYMKSAGFSKMSWPGFDKTQAGDIYVKGGSHVEICAQSGTKNVYNCGSNDSCNNPGVTQSGHSGYNYIWRPGDPGTGGQDLTTGGTASTDSGSTDATAATTTGTSIFDSLSSAFSSVFTEAGNRLLTGSTNTDFTSVANAAISGDSSGSSSSSDDSSTDNSSSGGTNYPTVDASDVKLSGLIDKFRGADLKSIPHVSPKQIQAAIKANFSNRANSVFKKGHEKNDANGLYKAQEDQGLSAIVPMAIGALESGWGMSKIARSKGNLWGWGAVNSNPYGGAKAFDPNDMGKSFGIYSHELLRKYYNQYGAKSINAIGTGDNPKHMGYAYSNDGKISTTWAPNVTSTATRIIKSMPEGTEKSPTGGNSKKGDNKSSKGGKGGFGTTPTISNRHFTDTYEYGLGEEDYGGFGKKKTTQRTSVNNSVIKNTQARFYRTTTKKSSMNELMYNMITILSHIAANTQRADNKLGEIKKYSKENYNTSSKKKLSNSSDEVTQQNNYYVVKDGTPQLQKTETTTKKPSRADQVAMQIATGGY